MLTAHELFGFMSPALAGEILTAIFESEKATYRATLNAVAEARRVRPVFLEHKSRAERQTLILASLGKPALEPVAGTLLRTWLLKKHQPMLVDFLDALEIKNENGVVDGLPDGVEDSKLRAAVDGLLAKYPQETVAVYLNAFNDMNDASWTSLKSLLEADPRLQLAGGI